MRGPEGAEPVSAHEIDVLSAYHSGLIAGMGETRNWLAALMQDHLRMRVAWRLADRLFHNSRSRLIEMKASRNFEMRQRCEDIESRIIWDRKVVDLGTVRPRQEMRAQNDS